MKTTLRLTVAAVGLAFFNLSTATVQAEDYNYITNNGTITITGYTGPGGDVIIPDTINGLTVTSIGEGAFYDCANLTAITIPNSVTSIGEWAFAWCTGLTSVVIPKSVTTIENVAFARTSLINVAIPNGVTNIAVLAFSGCTSLSTITVEATNPSYSSVDGVLFNKDQTTLIRYPEGKLEASYTISNSVTSIGDQAFEWCTNLTSVTIPDSVTNIPNYAFSWCSSLSSITIPNNVTTLGDYAFYECCSLTNVLIGTSVSSIESGAFLGCNSLTSVTIPNSVTNIGGDGMFGGSFQQCDSLNTVTIGTNVATIGSMAFAYCTSLTNVAIPGSVTSIGIGAFSWCHSLLAITVDPINPAYTSRDGVLFDRNQTTLMQCPAGKTGCYTVPNTVTGIVEVGFKGCINLAGVTISDRVTSIGREAFGWCTGLTNVLIGDGVTSIGHSAFVGCSSLTSVTIPDSVTSIGGGAFSSCTNLTGVYFKGKAPLLEPDWDVEVRVFEGADHATIYYLPGTIGWGTTFGGRPTALWVLPYPVILTTTPNFGIQTNQFGFRISWATNASVVVEASTTLVNPLWSSVSTNTLINGWSDFSDAEGTNYPTRFYRIRSP